MLEEQALAALHVLYRIEQSAVNREVYALEVLDRALDEISRHLDSAQPTAFQVRSARAHGAQAVKERREVRTFDSLEAAQAGPGHVDPAWVEGEFAAVDLLLWLRNTASLTDCQRRLLLALADGAEPEVLAANAGVPVARMRERIARARSAAREAYKTEVVAV